MFILYSDHIYPSPPPAWACHYQVIANPNSQLHVLFFLPPSLPPCLPITDWTQLVLPVGWHAIAIHCSVISIPETTPLKKTDSSFSSCCLIVSRDTARGVAW